MAEIDKARWARLSPLLDELLDLAPEQRPARLQALRDRAELSSDLLDDLAELLRRQEALEAEDFLASPALSVAEAASAHNQAGQTVGAYTLEREIGQGGMGTVWLARRTDGRFEGQVAIKFLNTGLLGRGDAGRFAREGQILARLTHPHIARLIDAGVAPEHQQPYLVLEYIDGLPLDRFCVERGLDCEARLRLFLDVLAAVAHAHTRLILHRDLKPSNILVTAAGEVKLLDFGIAKLLNRADDEDSTPQGAATELTRVAGRAYTPRYAAPEQVQGGEVTTATDVYALGVLLYLLLSGQHPTEGRDEALTSPLERLRTLVEVEPKKVSERVPSAVARQLRGDLDTIVAKALKKAPAERYANAAALAEDLQRWLAHEPITARPDSRAYRLAKFLRRNRVAVAAASLASLALLGSGAVALWKGLEAQEQRVQAEGLIEFMLGDLRKKLEPVGRLDVLDAVGEKALAYYASQPLARIDADSLGRRARALHLMGEIAEKRGRMKEAERMFQQAAASTGEMLSRDTQNTQRVFDHAQSVYWTGYIAWRQGRAGDARRQFESYLSYARKLTELEPGRRDWLIEKASAEMNLGVVLLDSGLNLEALSAFKTSASSWRPIAEADPSKYFELANAEGWTASALERTGQYRDAMLALQAKTAALSRVPGASTDQAVLRLRANTEQEFSRLSLALGQVDSAIRAGTNAVTAFAGLAEKDPDNSDWQTQLCLAWIERAEALLAAGRPQQLRDEVPAMALKVGKILAGDASNMYWQVQLKGRWLLLLQRLPAQIHGQRLHPDSLADFLQDVERRIAEGSKLNAEQLRIVASAHLSVGRALQAAGDDSSAQLHWRSGSDMLRTLSQGGDLSATALLAQTLWHLKQTQEARALVDKLEASDYRHTQYAELVRQISAPQGVHLNR